VTQTVFFLISDEVQAIASLIEKQAQIVVKQKVSSEASKKGKEALLAQYANVTDEEEYPFSRYVVFCTCFYDFHDTHLRTNDHLISLKLTVQLIQCEAVSLTFVLKMRRNKL